MTLVVIGSNWLSLLIGAWTDHVVGVSRGWPWGCPPGGPGSAGSTATSLPEGLRASDLGVQRLSGSRVAKGPAEPGNPGQPLGLPQHHLSVPAPIGNLLS